MRWLISDRADWQPRQLADRHYNRQKVGAKQFVPPGRCTVLYGESVRGTAFWVTSWPYPQYVKHAWPGAWICSAFRNEGFGVASQLIRDAVAATLWDLGPAPALGMITFIDRSEVRPTMVHGKPKWGWTWEKVGFREVGETKAGLLALQLLPEDMPAPLAAITPLVHAGLVHNSAP